MKLILVVWAVSVVMSGVCWAQAPAGVITGSVRDPSGAVITGAEVRAVSRATAQARATVTNEQGAYSFLALPVGDYDVHVDVPGFQQIVRLILVEAGTTTTVDFTLSTGEVIESVTVEAVTPQIRYDSASISGLTTRDQIENLPLNGRNFLELSKREPGVQPPTAGGRNRTIVPILGAPASNLNGARVTVDGGDVTAVALAGAQMGFSQELVQEFQVSTVNFDLSTGITDAGSINVVTRSGGNTLQGTAFYFYRNHNLAAYPALNREPSDPDPFFERRQFGIALGGPISRNRVFYFGNWERNDQRGVTATPLLTSDFAHFSRLTASPFLGDLASIRVDGRIVDGHTAFVRYSHDGSRAFGPRSTMSGGAPNSYPSNWDRILTHADQSLVGLTSVFRPTLVNDLRLSYFFISSDGRPPLEQDCAGCLGLGAAFITIPEAGLTLGNGSTTHNVEQRFHLNESISWQRTTHRLRIGLDWGRNRDRNLIWNNDPVSITLVPPDVVRAYNAQVPQAMRIPLPPAFNTVDDILQLPVQSIMVGIGDPGVLQENGAHVRTWNAFWLYAQDTWRVRERLTLNYGLGWSADGILNHDLRKPALLAPLLGEDGLGPTRRNWTNFSPLLGLTWAPSSDRKTVIRGAAGRFFGPQGLTSSMDAERVALGPPGLGRQTVPGSAIPNILPGIPGVPLGRTLDFRGPPTFFTGADLMAILPGIRTDLTQRLTNVDPRIQAIQLNKLAGAAIFPATLPDPSAVHVNLGLQREILRGFVVNADVVYRHFLHVPQNGGSIDVNHYNSTSGPAIPICNAAQRNDPQAVCSLGAVNIQEAPYRFTYEGLLVRAEKRLTREFQVLGSYAYSRSTGMYAGNGFNLDNWLENRGPAGLTHTLNVSGVAPLPWRVDLGFNFSYSGAPPFSVYVGGIDFNGDGTTGDLLPGTTVNRFNRGMNRADLERLVARFNETYAGTRDAQGRLIQTLTLPARYSFDDNFHSLDIRVSRSFAVREACRISLIAEVFNLYNNANLSGYSGDLTNAAFGQPTSRATQVFGSGGPRAFQLATRVRF